MTRLSPKHVSRIERAIFTLALSLVCVCANGQKLNKLKVYTGWFSNIEMAGVIVAKHKGWFKEAGIDLELVYEDLEVLPRVLSGEVHVGLDAAHNLIKHVGQGEKLKAFGAKYQKAPHCIVVPRSSKVKSIKDLKGKVLAIYQPQDYDIYRVMLGSAGLTLKDVKFRKLNSLKESDIIASFKKGEIDAILAWEFNWSLTLNLYGFKVSCFPGNKNGFHFYGMVYIAKPDFIRKNKLLLAKFLEVTLKGWQEVYKRPGHWATYVVDNHFPQKYFIKGSKELTLRHQLHELHLRRHYFYEGVGERYMGKMTKLKWERSLAISKMYNIVPATEKLSAEDLYTEIVWKAYKGL